MSELVEIKLIDVLKAIKLRAFFLICCGALVIAAGYALSCLLVGPQTTYEARFTKNLFITSEDDFKKAPSKTLNKQNLDKVGSIIAAQTGVEDEGIKISFDEENQTIGLTLTIAETDKHSRHDSIKTQFNFLFNQRREELIRFQVNKLSAELSGTSPVSALKKMESELDRLTNAKAQILRSYSISDELAFMMLTINREIASLGKATEELSTLKYQLGLMERHLEEIGNRIPWIGIQFVELVHEQELFDAAYQIASEKQKLNFEAIKAEVLPLTMDWQDRIFDDFKRLFPESSDENLRAFGSISRDKIDLQIEIVHSLRFFTLFNTVFASIRKSPSEAFAVEADLALLSQLASDRELQVQQKALSLITKPLEDLSNLKTRFIKSYEQILSTDTYQPSEFVLIAKENNFLTKRLQIALGIFVFVMSLILSLIIANVGLAKQRQST